MQTTTKISVITVVVQPLPLSYRHLLDWRCSAFPTIAFVIISLIHMINPEH